MRVFRMALVDFRNADVGEELLAEARRVLSCPT